MQLDDRSQFIIAPEQACEQAKEVQTGRTELFSAMSSFSSKPAGHSRE
jgi:hypothetical protein